MKSPLHKHRTFPVSEPQNQSKGEKNPAGQNA
jgi:hypothetical protein